jgi:flagellar basal-body rod modification protein FlgD
MSNVSVNSNGALSYTPAASSGGNSLGVNASSAAAQQTAFLKLLVAQMTHQDPTNPVDNAQMTSQIAQINTVNGIQQLNTTMQSMQLMQGTSLSGHSVLTAGNDMATTTSTDSTGATKSSSTATFDLSAAASNVSISVSDPSGKVIATIPAGSMGAGRQTVNVDTSSYTGAGPLTFSVQAANGKSPVSATTYSQDKVVSVGSSNGALSIQLASGASVSYDKIVAVY